ncbi:MAG: tRNA (adenosine(37)-N6)-dimethylallyltransferase MiaA [Pseudomonadota bacterium]
MGLTPRAILIAGPTGSGKSALALALARAHGGQIINADSQQIFRDWRILTARPTPADEASVPHALYGHVALTQEYSAGHWLREVEGLLNSPLPNAPLPVITGGTGLYFKALTEGLAPIPAVPPEVRARAKTELARLGFPVFADMFRDRDPDTARLIDMANPRRVVRAWEVLEASGTGLAAWQAQTPPPLLPLDDVAAIALNPPRDWLYVRCDARFEQMLQNGAMEEARAVGNQKLPSDAPGLKAIGARPLLACLAGETTLEEAAEQSKTETRRYAKRQLTWQRNQMATWMQLDPSSDNALDQAKALLQQDQDQRR